MTAIATALRAHSESAQLFFSKHHHWELSVHSCMHTAFKADPMRSSLAMIASSTAWCRLASVELLGPVNLTVLQPLAFDAVGWPW